jgi:hypothetical protein
MQFFKKKNEDPIKPVFNPVVPSGLIARTPNGYFYMKGKKRLEFISERAMNSWNLPVISTTEQKLAGIVIFGKLGFRDGSVIKDISDGKIYLISDTKRRHITNPDVLSWLDSSIIEVSQKEILAHVEGDPLNE